LSGTYGKADGVESAILEPLPIMLLDKGIPMLFELFFRVWTCCGIQIAFAFNPLKWAARYPLLENEPSAWNSLSG
jgi:hypothetical protein